MLHPKLAFIFSLLIASGCARDTRIYRIAESPNQHSRAVVALYAKLPSVSEWLKFEIITPSYRRVVYPRELAPEADHKMDLGLWFAEIAWSADSRFVSVYVIPCSGVLHPIWFTFDTQAKRLVPSTNVMEDAVRVAIRQNYRQEIRDPDIDLIEWAKTDEGRYAFLRRLHGPGVDLHALGTSHPPLTPFRTPSPSSKP